MEKRPGGLQDHHHWRALEKRTVPVATEALSSGVLAGCGRERTFQPGAKETAPEDRKDRSRLRSTQAKDSAAAAQDVRRILHYVEPGVAERAASALRAAEKVQEQVEEASVAARTASATQSGHRDALRAGGSAVLGAVQRVEVAVRLATHAAELSDELFDEDLAGRVALALRAGTVVWEAADERQELLGALIFEGVGLSYGANAARPCLAEGETLTSQDRVSFSVDSYWARFSADGRQPCQGCAPVVLGTPGLHMGLGGFSPSELDPEACRSLPRVLQWAEEGEFVRFLAGHSERSLALLLGSGPKGSLMREKLEAAASSSAPSVSAARSLEPALPRARSPGAESVEVMRRLSDHRTTLEALERAVAEAENRRQAEPHAARTFLTQACEELRTLEERTAAVSTEGLGIAGSAAASLQRDLLRHCGLLRGRAERSLQNPGSSGRAKR